MPGRARWYIGRLGDVAAVEEDLAAVGVDQADGHPEARGLARPVGAEQADDLALVDVEVDAVDDLAASVPLLQAADFQQGHGSILLDRVAGSSPARAVTIGRATRIGSADPLHPFEVGPERDAEVAVEPDVGPERLAVRPVDEEGLAGQQRPGDFPAAVAVRDRVPGRTVARCPSPGCPCSSGCCRPAS